jgi:hypothetical protein
LPDDDKKLALNLKLDIGNLGIDAPVISEKLEVLSKAKEFLRGKFLFEEKKKVTVSFYCLID